MKVGQFVKTISLAAIFIIMIAVLPSCGGGSGGGSTSGGGSEVIDTDRDGTPDTSDAFPTDPSEQTDQDKDGVGSHTDCNDTNASIYPGATETCGDTVDQDCSGSDLTCPPPAEGQRTDADKDGYYAQSDGGDDCNDSDASIHIGATETCGDTVDQDCSGTDLSCSEVDNDGDKFSEVQGDCDDSNPLLYPGAFDVIGDTLDSNCNGRGTSQSPELITTYAGGGVGDGGQATSASMYYPSQAVVDSAGNLYIADTYNNRIRKVDIDGTITTVAGTGEFGYSGDNGPAKDAKLAYPYGVAVDGSGNIYIADTYNNRIRKVDGQGNISTVAGTGEEGYSGDNGPAKDAKLTDPLGVAVDVSGNIYIADFSNHRIRKVEAGKISTVAGTGVSGDDGDGGLATAAQLATPSGVAVDVSGNIYIADLRNHRIRKVEAGKISTVAGTGVSGDDGDGGAATLAQLNNPVDVAVDSAGNLYIADTTNHRIRKVNSQGEISTVAGTGDYGSSGDSGPATAAQLAYPSGVAVDVSGNIYIVDTNNNRIRKVEAGKISTVAGTGFSDYAGDDGLATAGRLATPSGVAVDVSGNLYIADTYNNRIRKVDSAGNISTVAGTGVSGDDGDGGPAKEAQLASPWGVAVDVSGTLYIADTYNHRIRKVEAGKISTVAGTGAYGDAGDGGLATAAQLATPSGVAVDGSGTLYIADQENHRIRKVEAGKISTVAGTGVSGDDGDGGAATGAQLASPAGVAVDGSGTLYIADQENHRIRKVDSAGNISTVAGTGVSGYAGDGGLATAAQLASPWGVAVDGSGTLYIADNNNHRIRKVDSVGNISTVAGTGEEGSSGDGGAATAAQLGSPWGVVVDGSGNLYIAETDSSRIRKIVP